MATFGVRKLRLVTICRTILSQSRPAATRFAFSPPGPSFTIKGFGSVSSPGRLPRRCRGAPTVAPRTPQSRSPCVSIATSASYSRTSTSSLGERLPQPIEGILRPRRKLAPRPSKGALSHDGLCTHGAMCPRGSRGRGLRADPGPRGLRARRPPPHHSTAAGIPASVITGRWERLEGDHVETRAGELAPRRAAIGASVAITKSASPRCSSGPFGGNSSASPADGPIPCGEACYPPVGRRTSAPRSHRGG